MEELNAMRGMVPTEERDAFRAEMQNRLKAMAPEERQTYTVECRNGSGGGGMRRSGGGKR